MLKISLKAARVNAKMTQNYAAQAIGISKKTLQNYETGVTAPDMRVARKIEELYGIKLDDINFFAH